MSLSGKLGTFTRDEERAQCPGHGPVVMTGKTKADDGDYPVGLLLTRASTGLLNPLQAVDDEVAGTGNGSTKAYSHTLAAGLPLEPGTLVVTDGVETLTDDGSGRLAGSAGGTGTVNYKTGAVSVSFNANVGNGVAVHADYVTAVDGVLDDLVDTDEGAAGNYVTHGTVRADALKVGAVAKAAPSVALLGLLARHGIWAK